MSFKSVSSAPYLPNTPNSADGHNGAVAPYATAINTHTHDPGDRAGNYGNSIPAWGPPNPLYGQHGPGGTYPGNDWASYFNGQAAIPADSSESAINPATNSFVPQGSSAAPITPAWGIHGEIARIRGALALMKGPGANWFDPVGFASLDGSGNLSLPNKLVTTNVFISLETTLPPFSVVSTAKVVNLNVDAVDGYSAGTLYGPGKTGILVLNAHGFYDQAAIDADLTEASTFDTLTGGTSTLVNNLNRIRSVLSLWATSAGLSGWSSAPATLVTALTAAGGVAQTGAINISGGAGIVVSQNGAQILIGSNGTIPPSSGGLNFADFWSDEIITGLAISNLGGLVAQVGSGVAYVIGSRVVLQYATSLTIPSTAGTYYIDWQGGQGPGAFTVTTSSTVTSASIRLGNVVVASGAITTTANTIAVSVFNKSLTLTNLVHPATTTSPSAGGAGALPATPLGYVTVPINGVSRKIAYY